MIGTAPVITYHYGANDYKELRNLLVRCARLITNRKNINMDKLKRIVL